MIKRIVKLIIKENSVEDFLKVIDRITGDIASYKGCRSLEIHRATDNKNVFFTISEWDDEIALNIYRNSGFFRSNWQELKKHFGNKPEAWSTIVVSDQ